MPVWGVGASPAGIKPGGSECPLGGGTERDVDNIDGAIQPVFFRFKLRAFCLLGIFALVGFASPHLQADRRDERRIALYNIHTKETLDIVYMREGKRIPEAMKKINWLMRDWRQNEATEMDPELIDTLWALKTELGAQKPIHLISGYRSAKTNGMLQKTRGGQATKSQHILGRAADVHFPDVPLKKLRYSALVRQKGGVGYYPTSAIPFVHVDTGRVRHWPRLPRYELALLFPNGKSQHVPADGRPIGTTDVKVARREHIELASQISAFHKFRSQPRAPQPTLVANGWSANVAQHSAARADMPTRPYRVASLGPITPPVPKLVERPAQSRSGPSEADRQQLSDLVAQASLNPLMGLFNGTSKTGSAGPGRPNAPQQSERSETPAGGGEDSRFGWGNGWARAPAYDEEHPDELYYRPFPLAPLLTASASADDPVLARLQHPDVAATLEFVNDEVNAPPSRFTSGNHLAALLWTQQFTPSPAVAVSGPAAPGADEIPGGIDRRRVQTSMR